MNLAEMWGKVIKVNLARPMRGQTFTTKAIWDEETWLKMHAAGIPENGEASAEGSGAVGEEAVNGGVNEVDGDAPPAKRPKAVSATAAGGNPKVYFDVEIGGVMAGRIVMLLRADVVPSECRELSMPKHGSR